MKVRAIAENAGSWMTLDEKPIAKKLAADENVKEWDIKEVVEMAVNAWLHRDDRYCAPDWFVSVVKAEAEVAKNDRIDWNCYFEGSQRFDVWVNATAETGNGFVKIGFYLSDAWGIHSDDYMDFARHTYTRYYTEA